MPLNCASILHIATNRQQIKGLFQSSEKHTTLYREVREQYQIEITNRFAALENLNDDEDVDRTWENIIENIQTSAKEGLGLHELKQNKSWFDEECLGFFGSKEAG